MAKRFELMSKEEIMRFCLADCRDCKMHSRENINVCSRPFEICEDNKYDYLNEEITMKSRWELCKTDEDFIRLIDEAEGFCNDNHCEKCRLSMECNKLYGDGDRHIKSYCTEKVEVEE